MFEFMIWDDNCMHHFPEPGFPCIRPTPGAWSVERSSDPDRMGSQTHAPEPADHSSAGELKYVV